MDQSQGKSTRRPNVSQKPIKGAIHPNRNEIQASKGPKDTGGDLIDMIGTVELEHLWRRGDGCNSPEGSQPC